MALAEEALAIKREQNALSASTQEDVLEEIALETEVARIRADNAAALKELKTQEAALQKTINDRMQQKPEAEKKCIADQLELERAASEERKRIAKEEAELKKQLEQEIRDASS